ncbi:MAG: hypothetical protein UR66_C0001G0037 [Candidatus Moranbacteria bacterium GW2011_GWE1_35_17]|nr:MAG: hypothetical protein UR66_C0001G0037 [Candidatus Moranbacteria bacterium GW2011_GWE1_35_17]KKP71755.1 MAG: hypothetical protein UR65_C0027G0006 [Candidatus Moranbacteria bacterium GW2011_GWE2_35_164]KKP83380.1 MAG: hypothetical protein UR82_C0021G0010 [Candidatus Moranbacteria bacterium GW2011_GWF1_35_5]KKP84669.1 MAG: hypothetical protein UR83_C0016G0009 [Candidatus Moranbacteria bacterium GW2011_GWF2_35_54]
MKETAMMKASNGKAMFVVGALSLVFSVAFNLASLYTVLAFQGTAETAFQVLCGIGLLMSITSVVFLAQGLSRSFDKGEKTVSGIAIMVFGAVILVAGIWITTVALFNLWGLNNVRGFAATISVALVLFVISLGIGYWGYCRAIFIEKRKSHKAMGRTFVPQTH